MQRRRIAVAVEETRQCVRVAQLDRASGYGPEGQGFESLIACHRKPLDLKKSGGFWYFLIKFEQGQICRVNRKGKQLPQNRLPRG